jgi:hypothetical protein
MRKLPVAVAFSAALHGAAIAYVQTRPHVKPEPPRPVTTVEIIDVTPPPPEEPVAVALLDDHTVSPTVSGTATPVPVSHATHSNGRGHAAISTSAGSGKVETPAGGGHSPLMSMRTGEKRELHWDPSGAFWNNFEANTKPADIPPPPSGELQPSGNGTYKSDHGMDGAFTATVARDGTVTLKDKPTVGDVHFVGIGIAGRANFDDWAMHQAGIDPYASAKRQWLDKTRDERVRIGEAYRKDQLARTPEYVKRNLAAAWAKTAGDVAARKEALFELWDDCAEGGSDDMIAAGNAARSYILGFIRAHLPQGAEGAFTSEDLSRLNAHKRSQATFQPY